MNKPSRHKPSSENVNKPIARTKDDSKPSIDDVNNLSIENVKRGYLSGEFLGPDIRIVLLGAEGSGKTCLSHTIIGKTFNDAHPTMGADVMEVVVNNTADWQVLTNEERLNDSEEQICLEAMITSSTESEVQYFVFCSIRNNLCKKSDASCSSNVYLSIEKLRTLKTTGKHYNPQKKYISIWDFAGEQVFEHTHGIFVSEHVVCLMAFNASLPLDSCLDLGNCMPCRPVLQTIRYWMELVSSHVSKSSVSNKDHSVVLPTFILVGTHIDKLHCDVVTAEKIAFNKFGPIFQRNSLANHFLST